MTIYIAASFSMKEEVRAFYKQVRERGHAITVDWTDHKPTEPKKNEADRVVAEQYAVEDVEGIRNADVFLLFTDGPVGTGRYMEFGMALVAQVEKGSPAIYVIGEANADSIFYYHPSVQQRNTLEEVLDELAT